MDKRHLLLIILICLPLTAFAQDPEVRELQQKKYFEGFSTEEYDQVLERLETDKPDATTQAGPKMTKEEKAKIATFFGMVYVGMPKKYLAEAGYDELTQRGYRKEGNEEWITFLNWLTKIVIWLLFILWMVK